MKIKNIHLSWKKSINQLKKNSQEYRTINYVEIKSTFLPNESKKKDSNFNKYSREKNHLHSIWSMFDANYPIAYKISMILYHRSIM